MVAHFVDQSLNVDISSSRNNDILANVMSIMELLDLFGSNRIDHISITSSRLTKIMISIGSVVSRFSGDCVGIHRRCIFVDVGLECLHLYGFVSRLKDQLAEQLHSLTLESWLE